MTIRAVVYDFHRTLALPPGGTIWRRALVEALAERGVTPDDEELGRVLNASFPWESPEERHEHATQEDARGYFTELLTAAAMAGGAAPATARQAGAAAYETIVLPDNHVLYPETREVLAAVHALGLRQLVLSNHVWELPEICRAHDLLPPLADVLTSARLGVEKPHPESYEAAIAAAGCAPGEILFVGDTYEADVAGPERAGMRALLVRRPHPQARRYAGDLTGVLPLVAIV
ncbi:MAG TPA: HAD family hydrolase [Gaiellales bacterium]|nr:HAD family hydrolase [Gaiellales bacterium]